MPTYITYDYTIDDSAEYLTDGPEFRDCLNQSEDSSICSSASEAKYKTIGATTAY